MNSNITDIAAILGGIAALGGLAAGVWEYRRKIDLKIFREYTEKYNKIITPEISEKWNKACKSDEPKDWEELDLNLTAIAYLNLAWEEVYLHRSGMIRCNLWKIWWPEIESVLQTKFAKKMIEKHGFYHLNGLAKGEIKPPKKCEVRHVCPHFYFPICAIKRKLSGKNH